MGSGDEVLHSAITRDAGGIAVVYFATPEDRVWNEADVVGLAPVGTPHLVVESFDQALVHPDELVLLVPREEVDTVLAMDGGRDRILSPPRSQPIVLFLLRDGDGDRVLHREATSLRSVLMGSEVDPDASVPADIEAERTRFAADAGEPPASWLERWDRGELPTTAENYLHAFRARALAQA